LIAFSQIAGIDAQHWTALAERRADRAMRVIASNASSIPDLMERFLEDSMPRRLIAFWPRSCNCLDSLSRIPLLASALIDAGLLTAACFWLRENPVPGVIRIIANLMENEPDRCISGLNSRILWNLVSQTDSRVLVALGRLAEAGFSVGRHFDAPLWRATINMCRNTDPDVIHAGLKALSMFLSRSAINMHVFEVGATFRILADLVNEFRSDHITRAALQCVGFLWQADILFDLNVPVFLRLPNMDIVEMALWVLSKAQRDLPVCLEIFDLIDSELPYRAFCLAAEVALGYMEEWHGNDMPRSVEWGIRLALKCCADETLARAGKRALFSMRRIDGFVESFLEAEQDGFLEAEQASDLKMALMIQS
jgi:hypothetical protein